MFTPNSYHLALFLMLLCMTCWGSFANAFKKAGEVRFELLYWDYVAGVFITSLIIAFTLGSWYGGETAFFSNLVNANGSRIGYALLAGTLFNIANILLVIAISIAGMSVAFPVGIGMALVGGTILTYIIDPKGNPIMLSSGVALAILAISCSALAYKNLGGQSNSKKGLWVSLTAGILMSTWAPLSAASMAPGEGTLTPYTSMVFFAFATMISTVFFNTYFMLKPLNGEPVSFKGYFEGKPTWHAWGFTAGIIWTIGTASNLIAGKVTGFAVSYALGQSAPMVAALWGIFIWKEFKGAKSKAKIFLGLMFLFYLGAITLIAKS